MIHQAKGRVLGYQDAQEDRNTKNRSRTTRFVQDLRRTIQGALFHPVADAKLLAFDPRDTILISLVSLFKVNKRLSW